MAEPALKLGLLLLALASCRREPTALPLSFECRDCHRAEVEALSTSHHARGQAVADAGWFFTSEEGGALAVRYTLGVSPIVQVVVETATGRLQVPPMGLVDGGWVHVPTPLEGAAADWEGPAFNWNGSCAGCHATGFQVQPLDGGASRWRSLHVECEACHGETAGHRAWLAEGKRAGQGAGFTVSLAARTTFTFVDGGSIARPGPARVDAQSNACAACHSRRRALRDQPQRSAMH